MCDLTEFVSTNSAFILTFTGILGSCCTATLVYVLKSRCITPPAPNAIPTGPPIEPNSMPNKAAPPMPTPAPTAPPTALPVVIPIPRPISSSTPADKSRLAKASRIANEQDFKAAQKYLNENQLDFAIDTELSTRESLVLYNENEVKIVYRGTKPTNAKDLATDFLIWQGHEERSPQFKAAKEQIKQARSRYGQIDELLGYSLGGNKAVSMGNLHNIPSTTFNPFLGKSLYKGSPPKTTTVRHKVFRTTDDFATFGLAMMTRKRHNLDVESILPHKDTLDIREAHELENFTELGSRRPSFVQDLAQTVHSTGARLAELESVKGMVDSIKRGQTFTEHIHEFT